MNAMQIHEASELLKSLGWKKSAELVREEPAKRTKVVNRCATVLLNSERPERVNKGKELLKVCI